MRKLFVCVCFAVTTNAQKHFTTFRQGGASAPACPMPAGAHESGTLKLRKLIPKVEFGA